VGTVRGEVAPGAGGRWRVLVVDDDALVRMALRRVLAAEHDVEVASSGGEALRRLSRPGAPIDLALIDVAMPGLDGLGLLRQLKAIDHSVEVLMMSGQSSVEVALQALELGAYDFLLKPFADLAVAIRRVAAALERRARTLRDGAGDHLLVGASPAMGAVRTTIGRIAASPAPVVVLGESGTGKEVVARALHQQSPRRAGPFVAINCAGMVESLLESELFGHERGAFTGAHAAHRGLFEAASGGVLFLDEIGDMPPTTQAHLLRVLQEGEVRAVGATAPRKVDVRVVAATHVDLEAAVEAGRFRRDLYYRLATFRIDLPPLRSRPGDVTALAGFLLDRAVRRSGDRPRRLSAAAHQALATYAWPGNVRELEAALVHALAMTDGDEIEPWHLPGRVTQRPRPAASAADRSAASLPLADGTYAGLRAALEQLERGYFERLLETAGGCVSQAARTAGLDRANLRRTLRRLGMA
jgi:two-component system, NtrC family, response regulator HydG